MLIVAQPGTAKITCHQAEMSQAQEAFVAFKATPGQSFPPLLITLTQMKQYRAETGGKSHELRHICQPQFFFLFPSHLTAY